MRRDARLLNADAATLARVHARVFTPAWSTETFEALLAAPGVGALVAREGDEDQGLVVWRVAADEGEILTIGVVPGARGQGFGAMLLDAAGAAMRLAGCGAIFLEVGVDNQMAKRLYETFGFETVGLRKRYYRNHDAGAVDAAVMRLRL